MLTSEVFWKATTALVSAAFAGGILVGNRSRAANRFLAFFLLLIAGNQTAETFRALATTEVAQLLWLRIASVFASLDPFILYYFASIFPERNELNRPRWVAAAAAPLLVLIPGIFVLQLDPTSTLASHLVHRVWSVYTTLLYLVALTHFVRRFLADEDEAPARWMVPALSVAALPVLARFAGHVGHDLFVLLGETGRTPEVSLVTLTVVPALAAYGLHRWARRRGPRDAARWVATWGVVGVAFAVLAKFPFFYNGLAAVTPLSRPVPGAGLFQGAAASWRWLLFGSLVSAGIARHAVLDLSLRSRARAAQVVVGGWWIAILAALGYAGHDLMGTTGEWFPVTLGLFFVAVTMTEGFRRIVRATARALYGVPSREGVGARLELYREGVDQALAEDRSLEDDSELERLRAELGLDERAAHLVRRLAGESVGPLAPGELLAGRYRVQDPVGSGASGRTFQARDEVLERRVVLKEILHGPADDPEAARREARLAGSVSHPNVVTVHDILERPQASVLVTEHVSTGTLGDRLSEDPPPSCKEALEILDGVLAGLAAVHDQGIVHRDLKPANVLLLEEGTPKLADFGVATSSENETLDAGESAVKGTRGWMAPEQRRGEQATPETDLYALGVLARELLPPEAPRAVRSVFKRARSWDPDDRWPSARAMREALSQALAGALLEDEAASSDADHVPVT